MATGIYSPEYFNLQNHVDLSRSIFCTTVDLHTCAHSLFIPAAHSLSGPAATQVIVIVADLQAVTQ